MDRTGLDCSQPTPFANGSQLRLYSGRRIRMVVKVLGREQGMLICQSPDGMQVGVVPSQGSYGSTFLEVIGIAEPDAQPPTIKAEFSSEFGDKFDMDSANKLCQLANGDHKALFL